MVTTLREDMIKRLEALAEQQERDVNELVEEMLLAFDEEAARAQRKAEARRKLLPKFYERARRYWEKVGDEERLKLSLDEFDELFLHFDWEDIPVLKGDEIREAPFPTLADLAAAARTMPKLPPGRGVVTARNAEEILRNEYGDYLAARMKQSAVDDDAD